MKKLYSLFAIMGLLACVTGCFTKAAAHARQTTSPDGTITLESDISIVGTGDKASQVAADGMFADGAADTLGAGVKNASASQQSTGIKETFEGMGTFMGGLGQFMAASQGIQKPVGVKPSSDEAAAIPGVAQAEALEALDSLAAATPAAGPRSVIAGEGVPLIAILGNRSTCPQCRALWANLDPGAMATELCGTSIVDADKSENAAAYTSFRPKGGFSYPLVVVYAADGTLTGKFSAAGMSQAQLVDKVKSLVPACAAPEAVNAVSESTK